jgi:hypothetical protein
VSWSKPRDRQADVANAQNEIGFDEPGGHFQFLFLATASNPEADVLTALFDEQTEYGPGALTFQSLAVDAQYGITSRATRPAARARAPAG